MKHVALEMLQEYKNVFDLRLDLLKSLLKILIIYISRHIVCEVQNVVHSRKRELVNNFFLVLEKDYVFKKQVKEYAGVLSVTPNYLNDVIKEISGFNAGYHIKHKIILEAKRCVIFEGYSLKQAAYALGFIDPSHFSKYFKKSAGKNFSEFVKGISGLA
jgi:YesN/AraC family two-component response regulator